jgi:2-aminoadipate transaminase
MNDFTFATHFRPDLPEPAAPYNGLPPYNFVYGHNDPSLVPVAELAAAAERVVSRDGARLALYHLGENPLGHPGLRAFIAPKIESRGIRASADDVLITTGSLQGLDLVNQILVQPGDTVIIEAFTYGAAIN